jgi:hypothetical protein
LLVFCIRRDLEEKGKEKTNSCQREETKHEVQKLGRGNRDHTPEKTPARVYANVKRQREKLTRTRKRVVRNSK